MINCTKTGECAPHDGTYCYGNYLHNQRAIRPSYKEKSTWNANDVYSPTAPSGNLTSSVKTNI